MSEVWKPVVGFEGLYEVSDQGRVRSLDRRVTRSDGRTNSLRGKVLKQALDGSGYPFVVLSRGGCKGPKKVHNLAMAAFVGPRPSPKHEVRHLDGVRTNAVLLNLTYGTRKDNCDDARRHGTTAAGVRNFNAKLTDSIIPRIRSSARSSYDEALVWGVDPSLIRQIRRREIWRHV